MKHIFHLRGLIALGSLILFLIGVYMLLLIGPYFEPMWQVLKTVFFPFVLALILAYLLNPLVDVLISLRLNRPKATVLLFIMILGLIFSIVWFGSPIFLAQVRGLMEELPYIEQQFLAWFKMMDAHIEQLPEGLHTAIDEALQNIEYRIRQGMEDALMTMTAWFGGVLFIIVVPFLVFYLLLDVQVISQIIHILLPKRIRKPVLLLWRDINHSLGEYIRGVITVGICVGILTAIGYYLIGLPYPLFLAFIIAVLNVIPYFGPIIGAVPALLVALITTPSLLIWTLVVNLIIQMFEGNFLAPYVVGRRVHIHPIIIIFVILFGAELAGIWGLIFAVPVFVVFKVIVLNSILHMRKHQQKVSSSDLDEG